MSQEQDSSPTPKRFRPAQVMLEAERGHWAKVFEILGCKLSLRDIAVEVEAAVKELLSPLNETYIYQRDATTELQNPDPTVVQTVRDQKEELQEPSENLQNPELRGVQKVQDQQEDVEKPTESLQSSITPTATELSNLEAAATKNLEGAEGSTEAKELGNPQKESKSPEEQFQSLKTSALLEKQRIQMWEVQSAVKMDPETLYDIEEEECESRQIDCRHMSQVLDAVRRDFWEKALPLDTDSSLIPVSVTAIIRRRAFPSVHIELLDKTKCLLTKSLESSILRLALKQTEWRTITVILFLLTQCGCDTEESETAIRWAAEERDWRYVTAVAGSALKMFHSKPRFMLDVLGLGTDTVLLDRANRIDAIRNLVGCDKRNTALLSLIIKTMIAWAQIAYGVKYVRKWLIPLEIMEDFSYRTAATADYLTYSIVEEKDKRVDCVYELIKYAVDNRLFFLLQFLATNAVMTRSQVNKAARIAIEENDVYTLLNCIDAGADVSQHVQGSTLLQAALLHGQFVLRPEHIPTAEINRRNSKGLTLLHTAIDHWREDNADSIKTNIYTLCEHGADFRLPYPSGETVINRILSHPRKEVMRAEMNELLMVCAKWAADRGVEVDWVKVSGCGKNLLHVACENGAFLLIHRLIKMGADPLHHREGFTLIDTAITAVNLPACNRQQVLCSLCEYPDIIKDHQLSVDFRYYFRDSPKLPLEYLLKWLLKIDDSYADMIMFLEGHDVIIPQEYLKATTESTVEALKRRGFHELADFLQAKLKSMLHFWTLVELR